jgi:hypothetical protein
MTQGYGRDVANLLLLFVDDAPFQDDLGIIAADLAQGRGRRALHFL